MKPFLLLACLVNVALAQSNFYLGQVSTDHRPSQQVDALAPSGAAPLADVLARFEAEVILALDEQALSAWPTADATPRPGLLLFGLEDDPGQGLRQQAGRFDGAAWFLTSGQWLDLAGAWPPLLAGTTGAPLQRAAQQRLSWPDLSGVATTLTDVLDEPQTPMLAEPADLADPLRFSEIEAVAPAGSTHVMVLTVASSGEGGYAYEHRPVLLVFF